MADLWSSDKITFSDKEACIRRELDMPTAAEIIARVPVSVMRGDLVEQTTADQVDWANVGRWRFGWAPAT